jgi:membrane associated rhomboid family serine protease
MFSLRANTSGEILIPSAKSTRPWANYFLIFLNLVIFLAQVRNPGLMPRYQLNGRALSLSQFLTYAFLHVGWGHLLFNMAVLYVLGNDINLRLGQIGYIAFYLAGAVVSGLGFVLSGGKDQSMVGASGAVGAVMGAYLVLLPRSNISLFIGVAWLEVPSMYFVIIFFCYNLIMSLATGAGAQQVAYEAHIAGMVYGFLVTTALLMTRLLPRQGSDLLSILKRKRTEMTR